MEAISSASCSKCPLQFMANRVISWLFTDEELAGNDTLKAEKIMIVREFTKAKANKWTPAEVDERKLREIIKNKRYYAKRKWKAALNCARLSSKLLITAPAVWAVVVLVSRFLERVYTAG